MDFDKPKVYGDTSITDGLVFNRICIEVVAKIVKQQNGSSERNISNLAMFTQSLQKGKTR